MPFGINITAQTLLFLRSLALGACLMLLYDALRIVRLALPHAAVVVFVEDVSFFLVSAVATLLFLVSANFGEVRLFALLGEALGAVLCGLTVSRLVMACSKAIIALVRGVFRLIWRLLLRPIYRLLHWLAGGVVNFMHRCGVRAKKSLSRANFSLKRRRLLLYNLIIPAKGRKAAKGAARPRRGGKTKGNVSGR